MFIQKYTTPQGFDDIFLSSDGEYLTGLWFEFSRDSAKHAECEYTEKDLPVFCKTKNWLDIYFSGKAPDFTPKCILPKLSPFRKSVTDIMNAIPFGKVTTYGDIATMIAAQRGIAKMSAQAVGGAVGANPICIIVPCHRVVGANGSLTGYGGGIKNKIALLTLEKNDMSAFFVPTKGTAL